MPYSLLALSVLLLFGGCHEASSVHYAPGVPSTTRIVHVKKGVKCTRSDFACLAIETTDTPKPTFGEVLVKISTSSVNPSDVDFVVGNAAGIDKVGVDFSGTVVAVGDGCSKFKIGDSIWGLTVSGAYADYTTAICAESALAPQTPSTVSVQDVFEGVPLDVAGTLPEVAETSHNCLTKCGAPWDASRNISVVITSGSGGTGFVGIQLAKIFNAATVITSTSGAANIDFCKSLGADIVTDYKVEDIFSVLANDSVDVVFDNYGAPGSADKAMRVLRTGGVYLLLPVLTATVGAQHAGVNLPLNCSIDVASGGEDGKLSKHPKPGVKQINFGELIPSAACLDDLKPYVEHGLLKPHVYATFPIANVTGAFATSASGKTVGKISVVP